ncbi:MAG: TRAM domain-containing protein [Clostridiales bacterium]|nr:TRAM domain-containing protein [Clostridiales bacterium]
MIKKFMRYILAAIGVIAGLGIGIFILRSNILDLGDNVAIDSTLIVALFAVFTGGLFYLITPLVIRLIHKAIEYTEVELSNVPSFQLVTGAFGLIIGLIIAYFISNIFQIFPIPIIGVILTAVTYLFFAYLGINVSTKKFTDVSKIAEIFKRPQTKESENHGSLNPKILDTSVIIDGRIADIVKTGFIEGPIIIPEFILKELRHIADSSDGLKRTKGRRGLDILSNIQTQMDVEVKIVDIDFSDVGEVDIKLLKLAQKIHGSVVTNDFNLNKVALLQGVKVLNINDLSNAVKPNAIPGEEMEVFVIKEGKENNQGVAYLDDGTMIVVEGGKKLIGKSLKVVVTSVLQTPAGRMIFAKPN